jgi:aminoglycoside phosphotransferase (APT) family kinase protein
MSEDIRHGAVTTVADLLQAAGRHGLRLTADQTDFDRTGLDFLVVHARDEAGVPWIVRTPRRAAVVEAARVEARVLALVRDHLPVAVPEWRVCAPDVIAYPRLGGTPAVTIDLAAGPTWNLVDPAAPSAPFVASFAGALAALQAIPPAVAIEVGVPSTTIDEARRDLAQAVRDSRDALQPSEATLTRWQRWLDDDTSWPRGVALVHGDLHPGHMLLGDDASLIGILDWTEARVTDPSVDLAMYFGCFGRPALDALIERFERAGGAAWPGLAAHAAERWAIFPAVAAQWGLRTENDGVLEHARGMLAAASQS